MKLNPHISLGFNGQCEAAFRLYERCLDGTIAYMLTWGKSPAAADAPPGWDAKIYHATLKLGDTAIAGGDVPPDRYEPPKGFQILLNMDDPGAAERVFQALAENSTIAMPLQRKRSGPAGSRSRSISSECRGRSIVNDPRRQYADHRVPTGRASAPRLSVLLQPFSPGS